MKTETLFNATIRGKGPEDFEFVWSASYVTVEASMDQLQGGRVVVIATDCHRITIEEIPKQDTK